MPNRPPPTRLPAAAIGATAISPLRAWVLTLAFLSSIALPPLVDLAGSVGPEAWRSIRTVAGEVGAAWHGAEGWTGKPRAANQRLLAGFKDFETTVKDQSFLARQGRPVLQEFLLRIGAGNEQAYPGRDGWLFYRPELDFLTARSFSTAPLAPETAIARFAADLAARGVVLVLIPTPGKPLIHPEKFTARPMPHPPQNPEWIPFQQHLAHAAGEEFAKRGLDAPLPRVLDPTTLLWGQKHLGPQYLRTDSHWTPPAMQTVADWTARHLRETLPLPPATTTYQEESLPVSARGDTAAMLKLPKSSPWNQMEDVTIRRVTGPGGQAWAPDSASPVLLLGDSFSNIYSQAGLGWGEGAGFPEHLSARLGFAIDTLTRNDAGASATRDLLAAELARGRDPLAGKAVVVWQFAMRELATGQWKETPLVAGEPQPGGFLVLAPGETRSVEGVVQAMGPLPRLGKTPYKDYLTAIHLTGLSDPAAGEAVVYLQTMQNQELTPAARLTPGQRVTLDLQSWADKESTHGSMNRGELDDLDLQLQEPNFGTLRP